MTKIKGYEYNKEEMFLSRALIGFMLQLPYALSMTDSGQYKGVEFFNAIL
ncbi:MAG: hypothetical protein NTV00_08775 [Methylococcales bacterium]|nr:hypothetical protein [Methylococcales bacterium]